MTRSNKIAAIVPALNEEANVGKVLEVLLSSKDLDEIILVDDGSTDKTSEVGRRLGVKVIRLEKNSGKGNAMKVGVQSTDANIIFFSDADLVGLKTEHISALIKPVIEEGVYMCVGVRDRVMGLPKLFAKMDFITAIGGERVIRRELFENIPGKFMQGFAVETAMNYYCNLHKLAVRYVFLKNLDIVIKEKKWGFLRGFSSRIKMICEIIGIRLNLIFNKNEFI